MGQLTSTPFQQALDMVERLSPADQAALIELIRQRLLEQRRAEIAANAAATLEAVREGKASYGSLDDLRRSLAAEDIIPAEE